jgi:hypothetical protein
MPDALPCELAGDLGEQLSDLGAVFSQLVGVLSRTGAAGEPIVESSARAAGLSMANDDYG